MTYAAMSRYDNTGLIRVAALTFLALLVQLITLPLMVGVVFGERAAQTLSAAAAAVPTAPLVITPAPRRVWATTTTAYLRTRTGGAQ
ncbi:MAG: hypothetical protein JOZ47_14040 [Kutzneria sp.]|nr:hypothetical protein [Kutzneria sp.]MBV9846172.1 hypothetical protein [Kutzneria sp.]